MVNATVDGTKIKGPFNGSNAGEFIPLQGWINRKGIEYDPNAIYSAIELSAFGGPQKLVEGEERPLFVNGASETHQDFSADFIARTYEGGGKSERFLLVTPFDDSYTPGQQLFVANRILPERLRDDHWKDVCVVILSDPKAIEVFLGRRDVNSNHKAIFVSALLNDESRRGDQVEHRIENISIPLELVSEVTYRLIDDHGMTPSQARESLENYVEGIESFQAEFIEGLRISLDSLNKNVGIERLLSSLAGIRSAVGNALDERIAVKLKYSLEGVGLSPDHLDIVREIEDFVGQLLPDAQQDFYGYADEGLKTLLETSQPQYRDRYEMLGVLSLRNSVPNIELKPDTTIELFEVLETKTVLFALYSPENPGLAVDALVDGVAGPINPNDKMRSYRGQFDSFVFDDKDWISGKGTGHRAERAEFVRDYLVALSKRHEAHSLNNALRYGRSSANGEELSRQFVGAPDRTTGISGTIKDYAPYLARDRKAHREVINYLFENGTLADQVYLADAGALSKKMADRVYKTRGQQVFGKKDARMLEKVAELVANGVDLGRGPDADMFDSGVDQSGVLDHVRGLAKMRERIGPAIPQTQAVEPRQL